MSNTNITPAVGSALFAGVGSSFNLGASGKRVTPYAVIIGTPRRPVARVVMVGHGELLLYPTPGVLGYTAGAVRDDVIGNPTAPSQKQMVPGVSRFPWTVEVGTRTISIDCRQSADPGASLRPRLLVRGKAAFGVPDDVIATMDGTVNGWVTLTVTVVITVAGALWVDRERRDWNLSHNVWWDNVRAA